MTLQTTRINPKEQLARFNGSFWDIIRIDFQDETVTLGVMADADNRLTISMNDPNLTFHLKAEALTLGEHAMSCLMCKQSIDNEWRKHLKETGVIKIQP